MVKSLLDSKKIIFKILDTYVGNFDFMLPVQYAKHEEHSDEDVTHVRIYVVEVAKAEQRMGA